MDYVCFKIRPIEKLQFDSTLIDICRDRNFSCHQKEYDYKSDHVIAEIPQYCIDKMTPEQVEQLNSFIIP